MKCALIGFGKMGKALEAAAKERGDEIVAIFDKQSTSYHLLEMADVCFDFSHHKAVLSNLKKIAPFKKPVVVGTTGWETSLNEVKQEVEAQGIGFLYAPNFSLGLYLFSKILEKTAELLKVIPGYKTTAIEVHHRGKKDAPSGTALQLSSLFSPPLPFQSFRVGEVVGKHSIVLDSVVDSLTLTHEAKTRKGFALGALIAGEWLQGKNGWFELHDIFT